MDEANATVSPTEAASTNDEVEKTLSQLEEAIKTWSGESKKRADDTTEKPKISFPAPSKDLRNSTDFIFQVAKEDWSARAIKPRFTKSAGLVGQWLGQENLKNWLISLDTDDFFRRKAASNLLKTLRYCLIPIAMDIGKTGEGVKLLAEFLNCLDRYFENFMEYWTITDLDDEFLDQIPFVPESSFFDNARGIILAFIEEKSSGEESSYEITPASFEVETLFNVLEKCHEVLSVLYANFDKTRELESEHPTMEIVQEFSDALELFEERIKVLQFCQGDSGQPEVFCCESYFELCRDFLTEMPLFFLSAFSHLLIHIENLADKTLEQLPPGDTNGENDKDECELVPMEFLALKDADLACPMRSKATSSEDISAVLESWRAYWANIKMEHLALPEVISRKQEKELRTDENTTEDREPQSDEDEEEEPDTEQFPSNQTSSKIAVIAQDLKNMIFCLNRLSSRKEEYSKEPEPEPEPKPVSKSPDASEISLKAATNAEQREKAEDVDNSHNDNRLNSAKVPSVTSKDPVADSRTENLNPELREESNSHSQKKSEISENFAETECNEDGPVDLSDKRQSNSIQKKPNGAASATEVSHSVGTTGTRNEKNTADVTNAVHSNHTDGGNLNHVNSKPETSNENGILDHQGNNEDNGEPSAKIRKLTNQDQLLANSHA